MGKNLSRQGPYKPWAHNITNIKNVPEGDGLGDKPSKLCKKKKSWRPAYSLDVEYRPFALHYIRSALPETPPPGAKLNGCVMLLSQPDDSPGVFFGICAPDQLISISLVDNQIIIFNTEVCIVYPCHHVDGDVWER